MNKVERDGKVAVLVSRGYGAGWSTWNSECGAALCMDADIVQAVIDGDTKRAALIAKQKFPDVYTGGADGLTVEWVKKGEAFEITEYYGYESLHVISQREYMVS